MKDPNFPIKAFFAAIIVCILVAMCSGCRTAPVPDAPTGAKELAAAASCAPLPMCEIPTGSNSQQLEESLYKCVTEYRALYSLCYNVAHGHFSEISK